ncbi:MAG: hypothetical protein ACK56I_16495, partial [bacterium]
RRSNPGGQQAQRHERSAIRDQGREACEHAPAPFLFHQDQDASATRDDGDERHHEAIADKEPSDERDGCRGSAHALGIDPRIRRGEQTRRDGGDDADPPRPRPHDEKDEARRGQTDACDGGGREPIVQQPHPKRRRRHRGDAPRERVRQGEVGGLVGLDEDE